MSESKLENLTPMAHSAQNRCFGCGVANPIGLHLEFFLAEDRSVVCVANVADSYEGPYGYLHGGVIATLLDEAMSKSIRARDVVAMTRNLEIDYLRPVPSKTPIRIEANLDHSEGRKYFAVARILNAEGKVLAAAKGFFIEVKER